MSERFELLEQVGRGGMGAVWKARDTVTGRLVALKVPWEQFATDPYFVERLEREVELTRRIASPHVVETLGFGRRDGRPFIAMEFVEGTSLKSLLADRTDLTWDEARPILRDIALGLAAAHGAGVVHRDVKPSNVLVGPDGRAKLVDFGIARADDLTALTGSMTTIGTPAYTAPEGEPSPRADLYALGCIAYELLTGGQVFEGGTQQQVLLRHMREQPDLGRLPAEARPLVGALLKKRPGERPASAAEVAQALATQWAPQRPRRKFWRLAMAVSFSVVVGVFGLAAFVLLMKDDEGGEVGPESRDEALIAITPTAHPPSQEPTAPPTATPTRQPPTPTATPTRTATATATPTATPVPPAPPVIQSVRMVDAGGTYIDAVVEFSDPNGDVTAILWSVPGWTYTSSGAPFEGTVSIFASSAAQRSGTTATKQFSCTAREGRQDGVMYVTLTDREGLRSNTIAASFFC